MAYLRLLSGEGDEDIVINGAFDFLQLAIQGTTDVNHGVNLVVVVMTKDQSKILNFKKDKIVRLKKLEKFIRVRVNFELLIEKSLE